MGEGGWGPRGRVPELLICALWDKLWDKRTYEGVLWDKEAYVCGTKELAMKKYPRYGIRVSEKLDAALRAAGADVVRAVLEREFLGGKVVPKASKVSKGVNLPSWSKGRVEEGVSSFSGSAAPAADAPVAAPRERSLPVVKSRVFVRTPEERAEKLKLLQGMKMMPQMPPKQDFDALGDLDPVED